MNTPMDGGTARLSNRCALGIPPPVTTEDGRMRGNGTFVDIVYGKARLTGLAVIAATAFLLVLVLTATPW